MVRDLGVRGDLSKVGRGHFLEVFIIFFISFQNFNLVIHFLATNPAVRIVETDYICRGIIKQYKQYIMYMIEVDLN